MRRFGSVTLLPDTTSALPEFKVRVQRALFGDVTLGGDCHYLLHDLKVIKDALKLGLTLNTTKCEIINQDMSMCGTLLVSLSGAQLVPTSHA